MIGCSRQRHHDELQPANHVSLLVGLLFYVILTSSSGLAAPTSLPPVIDVSARVNVFVDPRTDVSTSPAEVDSQSRQLRYFRYLSLDQSSSTESSSRIFVGAVNHVYILNATNITQNYVKSGDLSEAAGARETIQYNIRNCLARGKDTEFSCLNHVRAVIRMKGSLFVCATGSSSPVIYHLKDGSLDIESVEPKGGRAKCPYDPTSNYTVVYVERGNPGNVPTIYTGTATDFTNSDPVIYRPPLVGHQQQSNDFAVDYRLLRTEQDSRWLNDPQFVGSFDIGDYVYFFFREHALEHANCGRSVYSRVARVCKSDEGGSSLSMDYRWTTFLKARLNCSLSVDVPFYFDELYEIQFNKTHRTFYGLFRTIHNGYWGTAVCKYSLASIDHVFSHSPFNGQRTAESGWRPVPDQDVPSPRPGQCQYRSVDVATSTLAFIKSHPLLHDSVDPLDGRPIYFTKDDLGASRLAVTHVAKYTILFIATNRGAVHKVVQWRTSSNGRNRDLTVAILRPFGSVMTPIWQMVLHSVDKTAPYLYLSTDDAVVQLRANDCSQYTKCLNCARDPHCGWDVKQHTCRQYQQSPGIIQKISPAVEEACNRRCNLRQSTKHLNIKTQVLHGAPLHLNCTSLPPGCAPGTDLSDQHGRIVWQFIGFDRLPTTLPLEESDEFILTKDAGIVVLSTRAEHSGTYICSLDGVATVRHEVIVLPCKHQLEREETWREEFASWCSAFHAYTQEFNKWMCFKKQCIKEKCLPQSVIDKCNVHT